MEEAIETLDAAIEYKNDAIAKRESELRQSRSGSGILRGAAGGDAVLRSSLTAAVVDERTASAGSQLIGRLRNLSASDARLLLQRYFEKAVDLRNEQRRNERACAELQVMFYIVTFLFFQHFCLLILLIFLNTYPSAFK